MAGLATIFLFRRFRLFAVFWGFAAGESNAKPRVKQSKTQWVNRAGIQIEMLKYIAGIGIMWISFCVRLPI